MELIIKYNARNYLAAVWYKLTFMIGKLKDQGHKYESFLMQLIKPLVAVVLTAMASFRRLRPEYRFLLEDEGISRSHDDTTAQLPWSRFVCYIQTPSFMMLKF